MTTDENKAIVRRFVQEIFVEGRKDTVFAVKLSVANPDLKLKPGMPADVSFVK